jgi:hypothetical protein
VIIIRAKRQKDTVVRQSDSGGDDRLRPRRDVREIAHRSDLPLYDVKHEKRNRRRTSGRIGVSTVVVESKLRQLRKQTVHGEVKLELLVSKLAFYLGVHELTNRRRVEQRLVQRHWNFKVLVNVAIDVLEFQDPTRRVVADRHNRA